MSPGDDSLDALRQALEVSPENVPLRKHIAGILRDRAGPTGAFNPSGSGNSYS